MLFIGAGIAAFRSLPVEAFPDVTDVQVTVITLFPGHAPEEVEKQVTMPLEIGLSGLPNAVRMFSHTQFGLSYIILTFDDNANDYFARQQVLERLQGVDLPRRRPAAAGAALHRRSARSTATASTGEGLTPTELRTLQDWVVEPQSAADSRRRRHRQLRRLHQAVRSDGRTLAQMKSLQRDAAAGLHGARTRQRQRRRQLSSSTASSSTSIRGIGMLRSADDIGDIVVAERNGTPLLIRDIADVDVGAVPRQGIVGQDDDDEIVIGHRADAQGREPVGGARRRVKERVAALNAAILPKRRADRARSTTAPG